MRFLTEWEKRRHEKKKKNFWCFILSLLTSSAFTLCLDLCSCERKAGGLLSCLSSWVLLRSLTFPLYFSISSTFPSLVLPPLHLLSVRPPLRFSLPFSCHSVPPPPHCCDTLLPLLKLVFFPLYLSLYAASAVSSSFALPLSLPFCHWLRVLPVFQHSNGKDSFTET